ncbi:rac GTPase-activating protein 1-like [Diorhabda sublineata]|uniref:rac GTPase-activating protein 1-like n=1 Tax=Diorhabda sublineata TaxID=1163346 RepID=UPI0024E07D48|nr:rac GTPase-activating protein 1-like [Diorhabda sublineata]
MCDTPFKPYPHKKAKLTNSDSEQSVISDTGSTNSDQGSTGDLTIVACYDELIRLYQQKIEDRDTLHESFYNFAEQTHLLYEEWRKKIAECDRLRTEIDEKNEELNEYNRRLKSARKLLDEETRKRKISDNECAVLKHQIAKFCNSLVKDGRNKLADDTKQQISNLYSGRMSFGDAERLSAIKEVNSTGSILSDFSYSRSEDDLDSSRVSKEWKRQRSDEPEEPTSKKRKSSTKAVEIGNADTVRATTTLTINKDGPITATSIIESIPKSEEDLAPVVPPNLVFESWDQQDKKINFPQIDGTNYRKHYFQQKTVVMPNICMVCEKHIRFGKTGYKCKECKMFCHSECKDMLPTPCVPVINTPTSKKFTGTVADYTPTSPPMVPSLIVHCVNEIEYRGLKELGIYRIPGSEKDVKGLKEKFLTSRIAPNLKEVDIHVICGCIKDFLRSLAEPLITYALWQDFVTAVRAKDPNDVAPALYETISKLPQPNRDTLAFVILHLQKVAQSPDCKMPADNLSKVFGPTIVGYSSNHPEHNKLIEETKYIVNVMSHLLKIPSDFWFNFINVCLTPSTNRLQQTPSTDSLLRPTATKFFTPVTRSEGKFRKKREGKFFGTPPAYK